MSKVERKFRNKVELRGMVHNRLGGHCAYCGQPLTRKDTHLELVPSSRLLVPGNEPEVEDYLPACTLCHRAKGKKSSEQFRIELQCQAEHFLSTPMGRILSAIGAIESRKPRFFFERFELNKFHPICSPFVVQMDDGREMKVMAMPNAGGHKRCSNCVFHDLDISYCKSFACDEMERPDGRDVNFCQVFSYVPQD